MILKWGVEDACRAVGDRPVHLIGDDRAVDAEQREQRRRHRGVGALVDRDHEAELGEPADVPGDIVEAHVRIDERRAGRIGFGLHVEDRVVAVGLREGCCGCGAEATLGHPDQPDP